MKASPQLNATRRLVDAAIDVLRRAIAERDYIRGQNRLIGEALAATQPPSKAGNSGAARVWMAHRNALTDAVSAAGGAARRAAELAAEDVVAAWLAEQEREG